MGRSRASAGTRFEDLYLAHGAEALRVAYSLTRDLRLAEDLSQEAFVRLLKRFNDLRSADAFRTYLLRTVVNLARSHFRRLKLDRRFLQLEGSGRTDDAPAAPNDGLWSAVLNLPERQRTAVILRYCNDLSERQTAAVMQISLKAVKSLVGRGLATLRSQQGVAQ